MCAAGMGAGVGVVAVALLVRSLGLPSLVGLALLTLFPVAAWLVRRTGSVAPVFAVLGAAPWLAVPSWVIAHPVVHVDNATGGPITVWLDGKPLQTVPAQLGQGEPPFVRVPLGRHKLGWSRPLDGKPTRETEAEITPYGDQLYNPDGAACHWLSVTVYGSASTHGLAHGPQALEAFQRFDGIDGWFESPPSGLRVPPFREGAVHVTLQRWDACMELGTRGCSLETRRQYTACMRTIDGRAGVGDCWGDAIRSCSVR